MDNYTDTQIEQASTEFYKSSEVANNCTLREVDVDRTSNTIALVLSSGDDAWVEEVTLDDVESFIVEGE